MLRIARIVWPILLGFSALQMAGTADAADARAQPTLNDIAEQQTDLRRLVLNGEGVFAGMDSNRRASLAARQLRVIRMLDGIHSLAELPPGQRVQLFNDLEWIKATILRAENDRKFCEFTTTVESHRRVLVCTNSQDEQHRRERACKSLDLSCYGP